MTKESGDNIKRSQMKLLLQFLEGSKLLFVLSIFCSAVTTLIDMLNPQIIRGTIDNAIGGKASSFPEWVNSFVDSPKSVNLISKSVLLSSVYLIKIFSGFISL